MPLSLLALNRRMAHVAGDANSRSQSQSVQRLPDIDIRGGLEESFRMAAEEFRGARRKGTRVLMREEAHLSKLCSSGIAGNSPREAANACHPRLGVSYRLFSIHHLHQPERSRDIRFRSHQFLLRTAINWLSSSSILGVKSG